MIGKSTRAIGQGAYVCVHEEKRIFAKYLG